MSYLVATAGRIRLPENLEQQALTVLEVELQSLQGRFHPDMPVADLAALARFAGADLSREGEWLVLGTDRAGEPLWSQQADAFYTGLGRFVTDGEVQLRGQDGAQWAYRYTSEGVAEVGTKPDGGLGAGAAPNPAPPGSSAPPSGASAVPPGAQPPSRAASTPDRPTAPTSERRRPSRRRRTTRRPPPPPGLPPVGTQTSRALLARPPLPPASPGGPHPPRAAEGRPMTPATRSSPTTRPPRGPRDEPRAWCCCSSSGSS